MVAPRSTCKVCAQGVVEYVLWGLAKWFHDPALSPEDYHPAEVI